MLVAYCATFSAIYQSLAMDIRSSSSASVPPQSLAITFEGIFELIGSLSNSGHVNPKWTFCIIG